MCEGIRKEGGEGGRLKEGGESREQGAGSREERGWRQPLISVSIE